MMDIRAERPNDIPGIYQVNVAAFGRKSEADLVDRLRGGGSTFSFVAFEGEQRVGHIFFSLSCEYPVPDEAFMVLELQKGALDGWVGLVKYRSEFNDLAFAGAGQRSVLST
jgi:predicted N-acetyltransferase YhbS